MSTLGVNREEIEMQPASLRGDLPAYLPLVSKGAMINLSGTIIRTVLAFGYTIFLARILPINELGQYFLMLTVVGIFGLASTVGLDFGVVRYVALYAGEGKYHLVRKTLWTALLLGVLISMVVAIAMIVLAPVVGGRWLGGDAEGVTALRVFAISIPFWVAARLFNDAIQSLHWMRYQIYSRDLREQLAKFAFTVIVLMIGAGLTGVVVSNVAALMIVMCLSMFFTIMVLPRSIRNGGLSDSRPNRRLLRYSFPLAFSYILGMTLVWIDLLILGYLSTTTEVGYYGAALRVGVVSSAIVLTFATVFTPVISDLHNKRSFEQLHSPYKTVSRWIFICTLPVGLLQLLFADPIMDIFGSQFAAGSTVLMILALSQLINASSGPAGYIVLMSGRPKMELFNICASLVTNITVCFMLIPKYGVIGAAVANMIAIAVINLMRATQVWNIMHMHAYDLNYLKPIVAGASVAAILKNCRYLDSGRSGGNTDHRLVRWFDRNIHCSDCKSGIEPAG